MSLLALPSDLLIQIASHSYDLDINPEDLEGSYLPLVLVCQRLCRVLSSVEGMKQVIQGYLRLRGFKQPLPQYQERAENAIALRETKILLDLGEEWYNLNLDPYYGDLPRIVLLDKNKNEKSCRVRYWEALDIILKHYGLWFAYKQALNYPFLLTYIIKRGIIPSGDQETRMKAINDNSGKWYVERRILNIYYIAGYLLDDMHPLDKTRGENKYIGPKGDTRYVLYVGYTRPNIDKESVKDWEYILAWELQHRTEPLISSDDLNQEVFGLVTEAGKNVSALYILFTNCDPYLKAPIPEEDLITLPLWALYFKGSKATSSEDFWISYFHHHYPQETPYQPYFSSYSYLQVCKAYACAYHIGLHPRHGSGKSILVPNVAIVGFIVMASIIYSPEEVHHFRVDAERGEWITLVQMINRTYDNMIIKLRCPERFESVKNRGLFPMKLYSFPKHNEFYAIQLYSSDFEWGMAKVQELQSLETLERGSSE